MRRNNKTIFLTLKPEKSTITGKYKSGLWIRDSTGGIGTLTFADIKNGTFASLGHGIYDVDTNSLLTSSGGTLYTAKLSGITKGCNGIAGELRGSIGSETLGEEVFINCENGIYGSISKNFSMEDIMPVAFNNEVKVGKAQIVSTVNNQKTVFDIEIEKIDMNTENKNMIIKITDKELIDTTGGIVQGMSGSPIIQNDKFVGAVTHVFLNDPTKGYAILAENMLEVSDSLVLTEDNKAA